MQKDPFMLAALAEARLAFEEDEVPVGCVIVRNGQIVGRGHNRRMQKKDATAHAEMEAIRSACASLGDWRLSDCVMYVTLEPCVMCAGAIIQSRIPTVYFGAFDRDLGCTGSRINLPAHSTVGNGCRCFGGLLRDECAALLSSYFSGRR